MCKMFPVASESLRLHVPDILDKGNVPTVECISWRHSSTETLYTLRGLTRQTWREGKEFGPESGSPQFRSHEQLEMGAADSCDDRHPNRESRPASRHSHPQSVNSAFGRLLVECRSGAQIGSGALGYSERCHGHHLYLNDYGVLGVRGDGCSRHSGSGLEACI